jgi:hypothetical protein
MSKRAEMKIMGKIPKEKLIATLGKYTDRQVQRDCFVWDIKEMENILPLPN